MNAIGIDVSKGVSTAAVVKPFGEVVRTPFEVRHTTEELNGLAEYLLSLDGETRVVMEGTGRCHEPIANALSKAGIFVSVVNSKLLHGYGGDTIRKAKTDKLDALKIGSYCLDKWVKLQRYEPEESLRKTLKVFNRQSAQYTGLKVALKNNLISLLDQVFPGLNDLFSHTTRGDGHEKWIDFTAEFWHCECVAKLSGKGFSERYAKFCKKRGYSFSTAKANEIYAAAIACEATLPKDELSRILVSQAVSQLDAVCETIAKLNAAMIKIAEKLPEYEIVLSMHGVGQVLAVRLIAEIGDVRKFSKRTSLSCFAGVEPPEHSSGKYNAKSRRISKQGSPHLRKILYQVVTCILIHKREDDPIFQFMDNLRKRGKPHKVYKIAACNKFLRIYYSRVKTCAVAFDNPVDKATLAV